MPLLNMTAGGWLAHTRQTWGHRVYTLASFSPLDVEGRGKCHLLWGGTCSRTSGSLWAAVTAGGHGGGGVHAPALALPHRPHACLSWTVGTGGQWIHGACPRQLPPQSTMARASRRMTNGGSALALSTLSPSSWEDSGTCMDFFSACLSWLSPGVYPDTVHIYRDIYLLRLQIGRKNTSGMGGAGLCHPGGEAICFSPIPPGVPPNTRNSLLNALTFTLPG